MVLFFIFKLISFSTFFVFGNLICKQEEKKAIVEELKQVREVADCQMKEQAKIFRVLYNIFNTSLHIFYF